MSSKPVPIKKEQTVGEKMEEGMFMSVIDSIMPKIGPLIVPASTKMVEYLIENNFMILAKVTDKEAKTATVFFIKEDQVAKMEINPHSEMQVHDVKKFIIDLISGKIGATD